VIRMLVWRISEKRSRSEDFETIVGCGAAVVVISCSSVQNGVGSAGRKTSQYRMHRALPALLKID
jgi:hypothetical protein